MSKASEWVGQDYEADRLKALRPGWELGEEPLPGNSGVISARVAHGSLGFEPILELRNGGTTTLLREQQAIAFPRWILDTFGEHSCPRRIPSIARAAGFRAGPAAARATSTTAVRIHAVAPSRSSTTAWCVTNAGARRGTLSHPASRSGTPCWPRSWRWRASRRMGRWRGWTRDE